MTATDWTAVQLEMFVLMAIRNLAILMTMPVLSSRSVPAMAKVGFGLLLALVLLPVAPTPGRPLPTEILPFLGPVFQEVLVGVLIGFTVTLVFTALQMAGQLLGMQMGLNIAASIDPITAGQQVSYLDQFFSLFAGLLFLVIDGHHMVLVALQRSFEVVPVGSFVFTGVTIEQLLRLTASVFEIAMRLALPVLAALFLADLALGIMARVIPQMNIMFVGMPLKIGVGLWLLAAGVPATALLMQRAFGGLVRDIALVLRS